MTDRPVPTESFQRIRELLGTALGAQVGVACTGVDGDPHTLYPEERAAVARAVERRQREFAAGRAAARDAMRHIGLRPRAVPSGPDRAPVWPHGLSGSISHTRQICVAAVAPRQEVGTIGIDVEDRAAIEPELWGSICTPEELLHLHSLPEQERGHAVARLFSAKEAFYKWQYPLTGLLLDFQDVRVLLNAQGTGFVVRPVDRARWPQGVDEMAGGIALDADWVITWVCGHARAQRQN